MGLVEAKQFYDRAIRRRYGEPVGAPHADIKKLETDLGVCLPEGYKSFLAWIGADARGIFSGTHLFVSDIVENTHYLPDFLEENELTWTPSGTPVVFYCHQGYALGWFDLPEDRPGLPFWHFTEGGKAASAELLPSFWDFIVNDMRFLDSRSQFPP